jgi:hypothetical protein
MKTFSDGDPFSHGVRFPINRRPIIQRKHVDGPLLHFSDGQLHWLTLWERFLFWMGKTDAMKLQHKLRPNLIRILTERTLMRVIVFAAVLVAIAPVHSQDVPHAGIPSAFDAKVTLGQVRELQMALASIETRDGKAILTCLGDIKPPCLPLAIASAIADDLAALSPHWTFYQNQVHKLIGEASGGTGYLASGSREETVANFKLFDLNNQPVTVRVKAIDINALEGSGVQIAPTIKAVLSPIAK